MINATLAVALVLSAGAVTVAKSQQTEEYKENIQPQAVIVENYTPLETSSAEEALPPLQSEQMQEDTQQEAAETPKSGAPTVRYAISDEERRQIERMVASEGGYCPYEFQALVAECILNGCEAENMRPLELFARGDFWLTHNVEPTEDTKKAVSDVFDFGIMPTEEKVRYYYNPSYCESPVHEQMCYVLTNCGCRFFKDWE